MPHTDFPERFYDAWPNDTHYSVSKGRGTTNHYEHRHGPPRDLIDFLIDYRPGEKDELGWSPIIYTHDIRRSANAVRSDMAVLDIDDGTDEKEIVSNARERNVTILLLSTHSHLQTTTEFTKDEYDSWREKSPNAEDDDFMRSRDKGYRRIVWRGSRIVRDKAGKPIVKVVQERGRSVEKITVRHAPCPKFRVVAPLAVTFRVADYATVEKAAQVWKRLCQAVARKLNVNVDPKAMLLSQCFFGPRLRRGITPVVRYVRGRPIDPGELLGAAAAGTKSDVNRAKSSYLSALPSAQSLVKPKVFAGDLEALRNAVMAIPHDEHINMNTWVAIIGAIHDETDGSDEGNELAHEWSKTWVKGCSADETEGVWQRAASNYAGSAKKATGATIRWRAMKAGWEPPAGFAWGDGWDESQGEFLDERTVIDQFNDEFAVITNRGSVRILRESRDSSGLHTYALLTERDFKLLTKNRGLVTDPTNKVGKPTPAADYWLRSPDRREYNGLVFRPGQVPLPPAGSNSCPYHYNIWRGWGVTPSPDGSCDLFLDHLRVIVCNGVVELFNWLLDWWAHLFQRSCEKPGVAIVLIGGKGTGKSLVGETFGVLVGHHHYFVASQPEQLLGKFNAHLADALLIQAEEAFFSHDPKTRGILKDLITRSSRSVEPKGVDVFVVDACDRLLITSNEDSVVPAEPGERRYLVCRVSDKRAKDTTYFAAIHEQLRSGGYERLLYELLRRDISNFDCRSAPVTNALTEQIREHLRPEQAWALDALLEGSLWTMRDDWLNVRDERADAKSFRDEDHALANGRLMSKESVRHEFSSYCQRVNLKVHMGDPKFGKFVVNYLGFRDVQRRIGSLRSNDRIGRERSRPRLYQIPPIAQARNRFCEKLQIDTSIFDNQDDASRVASDATSALVTTRRKLF